MSRSAAAAALIVCAVLCASASADFTVSFQNASMYNININERTWLSSASTHAFVDGKRYDTADGTLAPGKMTTTKGQDAGGAYTERSQEWNAGANRFIASVRVYANHAVFSSYFPETWNNTNKGSRDKVGVAFPTFDVSKQPDSDSDVGVVYFKGDMVGTRGGACSWKDLGDNVGTGSKDSGPMVFFSKDLNTSLVVSAFSNFMAHTTEVGNYQDLILGTPGGVDHIPAGFRIETIVVLSEGINHAMDAWGDILLRQYGKDRYGYKSDYLLNSLGYSTDNGAYYYYQTEPNKTYEDTLLDVYDYAQKEKIPYRYILLDSWWYFKGKKDGVTDWEAMPSVFPHGLEYLHNKTGWFQQLHNRYWSPQNIYAKQNGGDYEFIVEDAYALPLEDRFWDFLMEQKAKTGMLMYEQDWLDDEFDRLNAFGSNITLGRTWLMQMGRAAERNGMTIQYCMSHVRHVLQSVELPSVTNARASGDYHPGNDQWMTGVTGILAHAVGIAPSKDNYWSTRVQKNTHYDGGNATEPYNRLQSAAIIATSGPVAPSDMVGGSDRALIMTACDEGGMLLQPDKPATVLDGYFVNQAFGDAGYDGDLMSTYTYLDGQKYSYLFAVNMHDDYDITPDVLGYTAEDSLLTFEANSTSTPAAFSHSNAIHVKKCGKSDFQFYTIAPALVNGWTILGEPTKWISVSGRRFAGVEADSEHTAVTVRGTFNEQVQVNFASPDGKVIHAVCTLPQSNTARIVVDAKSLAVRCDTV